MLDRIRAGSVDWITLTSSATAERLYSLLPPDLRTPLHPRIRLATISPVTSEAVRRCGWTVSAEAEVYIWDGVVAAIQAAVARR